MCVRVVIGKFGGVRPLARALGHPNPSTVQGWWVRRRIPWALVERVIEAGDQRGITIELGDFLPTEDAYDDDDGGGTSPVFVPRADVIELIDRVARDWGSTRDDVTGLRRDEPAVTARIAVICAVYREFPQLSLRQIGSIFGRSKTWAYACVAETIGVRNEQV